MNTNRVWQQWRNNAPSRSSKQDEAVCKASAAKKQKQHLFLFDGWLIVLFVCYFVCLFVCLFVSLCVTVYFTSETTTTANMQTRRLEQGPGSKSRQQQQQHPRRQQQHKKYTQTNRQTATQTILNKQGSNKSN